MNKLTRTARAQVLLLMVEGVSLRAISRTMGASKNTILKLLGDAGEAFSEYQDRTLRNLTCRHVQVDEIWAFTYGRAKNVGSIKASPEGAVDCWTWMAIDADTKLIPSFYVGSRDADAAQVFIGDLAGRLANRVRLVSDGHKPYLKAVEQPFGAGIDHAMLAKHYGAAIGGVREYSPDEYGGIELRRVEGRLDPMHGSSYAEQASLTLGMGNRRFTHLTNGFSKKVENHAHSVAIQTLYYNFARIHRPLRRTPAMAAGVTSQIWELADMVKVLEDWEATQH